MSRHELLLELIRSGYIPYRCADNGYEIIIAWIKPVYELSEYRKDPMFKDIQGNPMRVPELEANYKATHELVSLIVECANVSRVAYEEWDSLEEYLPSSYRIISDDAEPNGYWAIPVLWEEAKAAS